MTRNPLNRRLGRQLVHDAGKYLGIFALLLVTIAVISGFLATLSSIQGILSGMDLADAGATVTDLLDRDQNQGISYLTTDMQGDGAMYTTFLYVLIAIMAFVFVILTNATVEKESSVIGTLLASGWRKGEILRHYLLLPALVGLVACALGNVLGYTLISGVTQGLYYNSYSIPPFHMTFDAGTFVMTSVVPYALLVGVTLVGLARKLRATPLAFLCHEVSRGRRYRGPRLPARLGYASRFRIRLLARNAPTLVTLFLGVTASSLLVLFSLSLLPMFVSYANGVATSLPTGHVYVLKAPYELEMTDRQQQLRDQVARLLGIAAGADALADEVGKLRSVSALLPGGAKDLVDAMDELLTAASEAGLADIADDLALDLHPVTADDVNSPEAIDQAEKLCLASLQTPRRMGAGMEDVTVYGIQEGSRYWTDVDVSDGRVVVGAGLLEKCGLRVGGTIVLHDRYADANYALTIGGANGNDAGTSVYMSRETYVETFGKPDDWFDAYASDEALTIDPDYLSSTTTPEQMRSLADQILDSFDGIVQLLLVAAALVFFVLMYLLTKTVLDHSARSIAYMKVFGYRDREIRRLYLSSITLTVALALVLSLPLTMWCVRAVTDAIMLSYSGNFVMTYSPTVVAEDLAIGFGTYLVVTLLHMRRIKRVPLELALKTQE